MDASQLPIEQQRNVFRYGEQALWSTQYLDVGAIRNSESRLFSTPIGGNGQGFTRPTSIAESNMLEGGRTPNGAAYDVYGIGCHLMAASASGDAAGMDFDGSTVSAAMITNLTTIMYGGMLAWNFTQTTIDIAPLSVIGSGGGMYGPVAIATNVGNAVRTGYLNNGAATIWMYRRHPVALPGATTFAITLRFGNRVEDIGTAGVGVKVVLLGFFKNLIEVG